MAETSLPKKTSPKKRPASKRPKPKSKTKESQSKPTPSEPAPHADRTPGYESSPYPGLQYYQEEQGDIFAGRDIEIAKCARLLVKSRVLVLHGTSGCGKSSFLRAGVKPYLARARLPISFEENPDGFQVIRSTDKPLRQFATRLLEVVDDLAAGKSSYGRLRRSVDAHELQEKFTSEERRELIGTDSDAAFEALVDVAGAMRTAPVFVIDQAEEVFTLRERLEHDDTSNAEEKDAEQEIETAAFFRFLNEVAQRGAKSRIIISLRTEYKGRFDDQVSAHGHPGDGLRGFYLSELTHEGLKHAITRPTLEGAEWEKVKKRKHVKDKSSPFERFRFRIDDDVVERLASDLLSERVPAGGILPALQIACLQLWRQSEDARSTKEESTGRALRIRMLNYRRLGKIETQVEEYLAQSLEEVVLQSSRWSLRISEVVEKWHQAFRKILVSVEADGRAVTRRPPESELVSELVDFFGANKSLEADIRKIIGELSSSRFGILRREQDRITLGHDSLALALNKWWMVFNREENAMMRMSMGSYKSPDEIEATDLFLKGEEPHASTIYMPAELGWDSQLPHFASIRGFDKRLGITLQIGETDDASNLSTVSGENRPKDWNQLRRRLWSRENDRREQVDATKDKGKSLTNTYFLAPTEWASFPGRESSGVSNNERTRHALRWTDVLVTDLFVGNGLIGLEQKWSEEMVKVHALPASDQPERLREVISGALTEICERRGEVKCFKDSARKFLLFAADICEVAPKVKRYLSSEKNVSIDEGTYSQRRNPMLTWLLENENAEEDAASVRPRYIVSSSLPRALAVQSGYTVYFGANDLASLARDEMSGRQANQKKRVTAIDDVADRMQSVVQHTLWQVSVPSAKWNSGLNRAFILRLAGLGYFTAEYVRSNSDEFVLHLHEFMNRVFGEAGGGRDSVKGVRLNRQIIRDTFQSCFNFLKFEEYGHEIYDLDSPFAYRTDHASLDTQSIADEIYIELTDLRRKTLAHFHRVADSIRWLKDRDDYDPLEKAVRDFFKLKQLAWNNYRIFNYYDSERYMARAAAAAQILMEKKTHNSDDTA